MTLSLIQIQPRFVRIIMKWALKDMKCSDSHRIPISLIQIQTRFVRFIMKWTQTDMNVVKMNSSNEIPLPRHHHLRLVQSREESFRYIRFIADFQTD